MKLKMYVVLALNLFIGFSLFAADPILNCKVQREITKSSIYYLDFIPENFPINIPLNLKIKRLDNVILPFKVCLNEKKEVCLIESENKSVLVLAIGAFNGEPFECSLCSEDSKLFASATVIPCPIEAKDEAGHTLSMRLISTNLEIFSAIAEGFEPFEEVEGHSISCHEKTKFTHRASEEGKIYMTILPGVIGESVGKASLELKGKTTKNLKVNYQWGME